jgi:hypothetical protein
MDVAKILLHECTRLLLIRWLNPTGREEEEISS